MKPETDRSAFIACPARSRVAIVMGWSLLMPLLPSLGSTVDEAVAAEMRNHGILGASVSIIENGEIIKAKGYGFTDKSKATAVTTNTLFQAGSVSKPVAALAALRLVEAGKLTLDDNVNQFLKQWRVPDNEFTKDQVPGSIWRYSGGGYTVMRQLMIDVTGETFPELMRESVLIPLGMNASTYEQPLPLDRVRVAATGCYSNGTQVKGRWHIYPEMAAAGLWTTPSDLARFAISLQKGLVGKSNPVISQSMIHQMLTVQSGGSGLGLFLQGSGKSLRFSHDGRDEGFDSFMMAYAKSGQGMVIMVNANEDSGVLARIVEAVRDEFHWPEAGDE